MPGLVAVSAFAMAKPGLVTVAFCAKYGDSRRSTPSTVQKTITLSIQNPRPRPWRMPPAPWVQAVLFFLVCCFHVAVLVISETISLAARRAGGKTSAPQGGAGHV